MFDPDTSTVEVHNARGTMATYTVVSGEDGRGFSLLTPGESAA